MQCDYLFFREHRLKGRTRSRPGGEKEQVNFSVGQVLLSFMGKTLTLDRMKMQTGDGEQERGKLEDQLGVRRVWAWRPGSFFCIPQVAA
jgi:hypothetical protein